MDTDNEAVSKRNEEDELFSETEDDLPDLSGAATFDALVVSTDWTTETLLSHIIRGNLELDPEFQRRDAWDRRKKSRFIESLIVGLPVPQMVLAERAGKRGEFLILDGKQRLLSIKQFASGEFRLSGLDLRRDLNRHTFDSLPDDDRLALETQTIRTAIVRNWKREEFLYLVFLRLNTANVSLSPQELRQALHPGPFMSFVNQYTLDHGEFGSLLRRDGKPDFRMRDVELLVRFFAFTRFLPEYNGNLKDLLDHTCFALNSEMDSAPQRVVAEAESASAGINVTVEVFKDDAFRRWSRAGYERPFNRAIFDVMLFYARYPSVRERMRARPDGVRVAFETVCRNQTFQDAITTTTKSTDSIFARLSLWGEHLGDAIDLVLPIPTRSPGGRIAYA